MTVIDDIKEYYADLLILQYRNKPKARETVKTGVDIYLGDGVVMQLADILNIDTAIGAQLDIIGKILGCPRNVPGINNQSKFFSFHVNSTSIGFSESYPNRILRKGLVKNRSNSLLAMYSLEDEDYRTLLKFKAFVNVWHGDMASMDKALYSVFGDNINMSVGNMSITYTAQEKTLPIEAAQALGYFKAPIGVTVNYNFPS